MRVAAMLVLLLAGCAAPPTSPEILDRIWDTTVVTLPADAVVPRPPGGEPVSRSVQVLNGVPVGSAGVRIGGVDIRPGLRLPAVVYLHGCTGPDREAQYARELLAPAGFVVLQPNHFVRFVGQDRPVYCEGNVGPGVGPRRVEAPANYIDRRLEEANLVVDRSRTLPFVDPARIVVMGHSMGGATASQWSRPDVAAVVSMGYDCNSRVSRGVRVPVGVPLLFVQDERDPWLTANQNRRCGEYVFLRANAKDFAPRHNDHSVLGYDDVREEVLRFLAPVLGRPG